MNTLPVLIMSTCSIIEHISFCIRSMYYMWTLVIAHNDTLLLAMMGIFCVSGGLVLLHNESLF